MSVINQQDRHPQVLDRRIRVYTDQHGRKWVAQVSKRTDHPVEPLRPRGWSVPVKGGLPPQRYLKVSLDPENANALTVDYGPLSDAYRASYEEWRLERDRQGRAMLKSAYNPDAPANEVLDVVGPEPFPWQYWEACRNPELEGHEWALGLSDARPTWADRYFSRPVDGLAFMRKKAVVDLPAASPKRAAGAARA
jgi:hypothetical protein